jgi:dipeptidyl aminopeptidase/acylaminoacyl peptidase
MRWAWILLFLVSVGLGVGGYVYFSRSEADATISPIGQLFEKPLEKYTIDRLSSRLQNSSEIIFDEIVATEAAYRMQSFHYLSDGLKVTGLAHIPSGIDDTKKAPVIVQVRGYVEAQLYTPGVGTKRSAEIFAQNGFISLAPDFLGYGGSDNPSEDVFEERFQTYTAFLDLLASIPSVSFADPARVGLWAHSNGGQIALTALEITQKAYPTTLWAPVTKPFPYSILYYTDEAPDHGKALRKKLADFEKDYDVENYTLVNFIDRIQAPLQIHQGTADAAVPSIWNDVFVEELEKKDIDVDYFVYPGADHNLQPSWNTVVSRDIAFFRRLLGFPNN